MNLTQLIHASAHELPMLTDGSVNTIITSPPYFGLRAYDGEQAIEWPGVDYAPMAGLPMLHVQGCAADCEHEWGEAIVRRGGAGNSPDKPSGFQQKGKAGQSGALAQMKSSEATSGAYCQRCGGWRGALGHEPTPEAYIAHLILALREWRRVLHDSGTCWVNLGDSFYNYRPGKGSALSVQTIAGHSRGEPEYTPRRANIMQGLKEKDLMLIPARFALAAQADGWYLRQAIIWAKGISFCPTYAGSSMPESVRDRPSTSHEYIFLLAKRERYFFDMEAVREAWVDSRNGASGAKASKFDSPLALRNDGGVTSAPSVTGRNLRSVWAISPRPYSAAHFAVWPAELVTPMVKAGASEHGVCSQCYAPWERVLETTRTNYKTFDHPHRTGGAISGGVGKNFPDTTTKTIGWQPTCQHDAPIVPAAVLDPFCGSGTTLRVAAKLGRRGIGVDLAESYLDDLVPDRTTVQMELGGIA